MGSIENKLIKRNAILATGAFAIGIAGVAGCAPKQEQSTQTNIPEKQTTATMPSQGNVIETPTGIYAVTPTATLTTFNYPTPVPTEIIKAIEKSPLTTYDAYYGTLSNPQTGKREGTIVLASIPQKNGSDQILIFYEKTDSTFNAYLANLQEIQDNNFKGRNVANSWASAGIFAVEGAIDSSKKKITGIISSNRKIMGTMTHEELKFDVNYYGNGKEKTIEAAKKAKYEIDPKKWGAVTPNQLNLTELQDPFGIKLP